MLAKPLKDITESVIFGSHGRGRIETRRVSGRSVFLGSLVAFIGLRGVDLAKGNVVIDGIIIGEECKGYPSDLSRDVDDPYPNGSLVQVYMGYPGDQAWCYIRGKYELMDLDRVIGYTLNEVEGLTGTAKFLTEAIKRKDTILTPIDKDLKILDTRHSWNALKGVKKYKGNEKYITKTITALEGNEEVRMRLE